VKEIPASEAQHLLADIGFRVSGLDRLAAREGDEATDGPVRLVPASTIRSTRPKWLWEGRIPLGSVTVKVGPPGQGKTNCAVDLGSRATRGQLAGDLRGEPISVAIASAEDAWDAILRPRFEAAGADLERVFFIEADGGFTIPDHLDALADRMRAEGARFAIVDPFVAHLPRQVNSWRDHDVRRAFAPLAAMAEDLVAAVVVVMHFNKSATADVLSKVSGSVAFGAAARSVLAFAPNPSDPDGPERVVVHVKSNYSKEAVTLRYRIEERTVLGPDGEDIPTSGLVWCGEAPEVGKSDVVDRATPEERSERDEAAGWLRDFLADGPRPASEVYTEGRGVGFSRRTLERAKADARVRSRKAGRGGGWVWALPVPVGDVGDVRPPPAEMQLAAFEDRHANDIGDLRADPERVHVAPGDPEHSPAVDLSPEDDPNYVWYADDFPASSMAEAVAMVRQAFPGTELVEEGGRHGTRG
jgi:hypothetical protein